MIGLLVVADTAYIVGNLTNAQFNSWLSRNTQGMVRVNDSIVSQDSLDSVAIGFVWQDFIPTKPDKVNNSAPERPSTNAVPFEPYICVSVKAMNDLCATGVWHCGLGARLVAAAAAWLAAVYL